MFFYTLTSFAEWERNVIRERTWSGRMRRAEQGRNPGFQPPYGYTYGPEKGTLATIPHEAAVVRRIFREYAAGAGIRAIVSRLNADGLPFRAGRTWVYSTVHHMLNNAIYTGTLIYGAARREPRHRPPSGRTRTRRPQPLIRVPGALPAIISQEDFDLVARLRQERPTIRRGSGRSHSSPYLLTGIARCGLCRGLLKGKQGSGRGTGPRYVCTTRETRGVAVCSGRSFRQADLDASVAAELQRLHGSRVCRPYLAAALGRQGAEEAAVRAALKRSAETETRAIRQLARISKDYRAGLISAQDFSQFRSEAQRDAARAREQQQQLAATLDCLRAQRAAGRDLEGWLATSDPWQILTPVERKQVCRHLVRAVAARRTTPYEVNCDVEWNVTE